LRAKFAATYPGERTWWTADAALGVTFSGEALLPSAMICHIQGKIFLMNEFLCNSQKTGTYGYWNFYSNRD
jgi:hypothetical protein